MLTGPTVAKLRTAVRLVRAAWLTIGIAIVLLCLVEGAASLAFLVRDATRGSGPLTPDPRMVADTYAGAPWVSRYFEEFHRSRILEWRSYVYWRRRSYRGEHINVDADGIRRTITTEPAQQESRAAVRIFMFGGSTLWGSGARDAFTIPSLLTRALRHEGVATEIVNFGEIGYVSTQQVLALLLRLQGGHRPDVVIFYDGVNDTFSAYQQRVAGLPQNELNRVKGFDLSRSSAKRRETVLNDVTNNLATVRVLRKVLGGVGARDEGRQRLIPLRGERRVLDDGALAREVLDTYTGNVEVVQALGAHYGFTPLFYWQPTIFQKEHVTAYERGEREKEQRLEPLFRQVYAAVRESRLAERTAGAFHDLSLVFSAVRDPIYIDWSHLGEAGNQRIAGAMTAGVLGAIAAGHGGSLK